jgi:hypothetical protein
MASRVARIRLPAPNDDVEDKASGTQLIQGLIEEGLSRVKGVKPDGDKIMCLHAQTATIESGFVHIPTNAADSCLRRDRVRANLVRTPPQSGLIFSVQSIQSRFPKIIQFTAFV